MLPWGVEMNRYVAAAWCLLSVLAVVAPARATPVTYDVAIDFTTDNRRNPAPANPDLILTFQIDSSFLAADGSVSFANVEALSVMIAPDGFAPEGYVFMTSLSNWGRNAYLLVSGGDVVAIDGFAMDCLDGRSTWPDTDPLCETGTVPGLVFDADGTVFNPTSGSHFPSGTYSVSRVIPEPDGMLLFAAGLVTAFVTRRRRSA